MEGCGFVPNVARLRFAQAVTGSVLAWLVLASHHGLLAPAMILAGNAGVASIWLLQRRNLLLALLRHNPGQHQITWMKEIWHFQWRIAVSFLCGYFLFQLYNPILFAFRGAVVAGQMGMSLSLANALQSVAVSWISTKSAPFGALIARREYRQLDRIFFQAIRQAVTVCIVCATLTWVGCIYVNLRHFKFANRLLDPTLLGLLFLNATVNVVIFGQAYYLRAHKQEKFLINSVVGAITSGLTAFFLGRRYGAAGMVITNSLLNVVGLVWATLIFVKYRRIWHAG
jgi:O-antigen/teichoic acid export membrane protein